MLIQKLSCKDDTYCIGISEISNSNELGVNQLLDLSKSYSENALAVQFFNSLMVVNDLHLLSAAQNAINAWSGGYMISRSLDVEIIVYASAQRQIHQALDMMGVKDGLATISVVVIDKHEENVNEILVNIIQQIGKEMQPFFSPTEERVSYLMKVFDVKTEEMKHFINSNSVEERTQALGRCIASRVSLVAIGM